MHITARVKGGPPADIVIVSQLIMISFNTQKLTTFQNIILK